MIWVQYFGWAIIFTVLVGWRNEHLPLNKTAHVRAVPHSTVGDVFSQTFSKCKYLEVVMHMQFDIVVQGHMFHIELRKWLQSTRDTLACTQGKQFTSVKADNLNIALNTSLYILTFCWPCISVINQRDAQNFCFTRSLFHASTCFKHMCSSSEGQNCITQSLVSSHLQVAVSCTGWERTGSVLSQSHDDERICSKHVEAWNKFIVKQKFCASSWLITEIKPVCKVGQIINLAFVIKIASTSAEIRMEDAFKCCAFSRSVWLL